jgi:hypothetical protein
MEDEIACGYATIRTHTNHVSLLLYISASARTAIGSNEVAFSARKMQIWPATMSDRKTYKVRPNGVCSIGARDYCEAADLTGKYAVVRDGDVFLLTKIQE